MAVSGHDGDRLAGLEDGTAGRNAPQVDIVGDGSADPERPSWPHGARLLVAAALVVLALGAVAVVATLSDPHRLGVAFSGGGRTAGPTVTVAADPGGLGAAAATSAQPANGQVQTAPLAGRRRASFELVDGLTGFDLRVDDLGEELYRIGAPAGSGRRPRPEVLGDRVLLRLEPGDRPGPGTVEVVLNARVTWRLRLAGGVSEQRIDLTGARLAGVELVGGSARTDLRLPRVTGTVTVRLTGGVNRFDLQVPGSPPVRVRVAAGAGAVAIYDQRSDGVAAGSLLGSPGWDRSVDRVYVDLVAGANTVNVAGD
ncbi:hypothetical protein NCC78_19380 [Micromonospora phytophila]|uniref:hypothetical protein n=1 Tax=Micromonospora phytophila TaxID=709888 RepID=UPI00203089DA|nr:hypothetical protein [Micromonospora phytophila]MCM0676831.1 hypothetical protein [Micromonospora phytophila]